MNLQKTIFLTFLLAAVPAWAQVDAKVTGTVKDQDGQVIAGASVAATGQKSAAKRSILSDKSGQFVLTDIPPDTYEITASTKEGADVAAIVDLGAGQSRVVDLVINLKSSATVISLDNHATTVELGSARLSANVTSDEVASLPVNGRTFGPLALSAPLVSNAGEAIFSEVRFAGQSSEQNRFSLDGIDVSSVVTAYPGFLAVPGYQFRLSMSTEPIQEFRVDSAIYGAEQGGSTGGQVNLVSKSAGNSWHGAAFEYFRNDRLAARNFFDGASPDELRMNQFGANAGGALKPNRLFVFLATEQLRQQTGRHDFELVPSSDLRAGAVSVSAGWLAAMPSGTAATGDPDVDASARSDVAQQNESTYNLRADYLVGIRHRFFLQYSRSSGTLLSPDDTTTARNIDGSTTTDHAVLTWSAGFGDTGVNQLSAGLNRSPSRVHANVNSPWLASERVIVGSASDGGFASPGGLVQLFDGTYGSGAEYAGRSYSLHESAGVTHGAHQLRAGFDYRAARVPFDVFGGTVFTFRDPDSLIHNEDADISFIADLPASKLQQSEVAAYFQDEWKPTANLSVTAGLRYDYFGAPSEQKNRATILNPFSLLSQPANGGFYQASKLGFEPRIALTWAPQQWHNNTVVRVGAGIYNGPPALLSTLSPITAAVPHLFLAGGTLADTPQTLAANDATRQQPQTLDVSSFGKPQRNIVYSASIQQSLPGKLVGQVGYLGLQSRHLTQAGESNLGTGVDSETGATLRPAAGFTAVRYLTNGGTASYNGLQLGLNRRFVDSFTLSASYNWTRGIGNSDGAGDQLAPQNANCLACERADNSTDVRQSMSVSAVYALPFGVGRQHFAHGVAAGLLGGWTMAGTWNARTGLPLNVTIDRPDEIYYSPSRKLYYSPSADLPADAVATVNTPGGGEGVSLLRPNVVAGVNPYLRNTTSHEWLNAAAFSVPQAGAFGNLGRNALRGPDFSQIDLQIARTFRFSENLLLRVRADAYNLANHTNFANPGTVLTDSLLELQPGSPYTQSLAAGFSTLGSTVGRTVGLGTSRQIQLGLRLEF